MWKAVAAVFALAVSADAAIVLQPPLGLDLYMPVPASNPLTREKVNIGRRLFFDTRLSRDSTLSCASCHDPSRAFSDGRVVSIGIDGAAGTRNSPAIVNRGYGTAFFWDGRARSLEQLALEPILDPRELGLTRPQIEQRTGLRAEQVADALASYLRTIRSGDSRYDRYAAGNRRAFNALEREGLDIFRGNAGCTACHAGPMFSDDEFHNTGVAWRDGRWTDEGRFAVTGVEGDRGAFKTPTLREVPKSAPYMHDGSLPTLEAVVDFYADGGRANPNLSTSLRPVPLTSHQKGALVAFLRTLAGRVREGA